MKSTRVKQSVVIGGRKTSVSLEKPFWKAFRQIARRRGLSAQKLIEIVDADRKDSNLSSAIRLFVLEVYRDQIEPPEPKPKDDDLKLVG
jgi:predicted DNA-binding ribbon-helix-helix protein